MVAALVAVTAAVPAAAPAHYPHEWEYAHPPDWFNEFASGAPCEAIELPQENSWEWSLYWDSPPDWNEGGCAGGWTPPSRSLCTEHVTATHNVDEFGAPLGEDLRAYYTCEVIPDTERVEVIEHPDGSQSSFTPGCSREMSVARVDGSTTVDDSGWSASSVYADGCLKHMHYLPPGTTYTTLADPTAECGERDSFGSRICRITLACSDISDCNPDLQLQRFQGHKRKSVGRDSADLIPAKGTGSERVLINKRTVKAFKHARKKGKHSVRGFLIIVDDFGPGFDDSARSTTKLKLEL